MIIRLSMPKLTPNECYKAKCEGGINPCIARPSGTDKTAFPYRNCVFYAWARMRETWGTELPSINAERYFMYAQQQHWIISGKPIRGAAIVWAKGSAVQSSDGAGHIAVCEEINSNGRPVTELQLALASAGYLRQNEVDGDFGRITLGAVCAYQLEHKLTVDGICGEQTAVSLWGGADNG